MSRITPTSLRKPASGNPARQLVILLHGWGADGPNLIDLADVFAQVLPDAHFISPNAPFVCEANPYGFQWFSLMDRNPKHMLAGTIKAVELLNEFIDEQLSLLEPSPYGRGQGEGFSSNNEQQTTNNVQQHPNPLPEGEGIKLALVGFSQGTMVALHLAMRRSPQIAAVVGFSGALVAADILEQEITEKPPVCLIHGSADDVVPYASMEHATNNLRKCGISVESHTRPSLGHSIDMEGIAIAMKFLQEKFFSLG